MEISTIILGIIIGFILFWLGYLTASMMFISKHTDEVDELDNKNENENKNNIERNK